MDKATAQKISAEMQVAAAAIAAKHGLAFSVNRGTFSNTDYTFKGTFNEVVKSESGDATQTAKLLSRAKLFGIDPSKPVTSRGISYTLVDYQDRAHKYPWVAQDALGNRIRFPDATVQKFCSTQPA